MIEFQSEQRPITAEEIEAFESIKEILRSYNFSEVNSEIILKGLISKLFYSPMLYELYSYCKEIKGKVNNTREILDSIYRNLRNSKKEYEKFNLVHSCMLGDNTPIYFLSENGTKVTYVKYTKNLKYFYTSKLNSSILWGDEEVSQWIDEELLNKINSNKFMDTLDLASKRLFIQEIDLTKFITNYTAAKENGVDAATIRDYANYVIDALKPPELIITKDPDEIAKVYSSGVSTCMTTKSSYAWCALNQKYGFHPMKFYAHHPYTSIAYMKRNGVTAARCVLFDLPDGRKIVGRRPASTRQDKEALEKALIAKGYSLDTSIYEDRGSPRFSVEHSCTFELPAFDYPEFKKESKYVTYLPYMDNIRSGVKYTLKERETTKEKYFEVTIDIKKGQRDNSNCTVNVLDPGGYYVCRYEKNGVVCSFCGVEGEHILKPKDAEGFVYCSYEHAMKHGNNVVIEMDGTFSLRSGQSGEMVSIFSNDIKNPFLGCSRVYFSNIFVAYRYGFFPYFSDSAYMLQYLTDIEKFSHIKKYPFYTMSYSNYKKYEDLYELIYVNTKYLGHVPFLFSRGLYSIENKKQISPRKFIEYELGRHMLNDFSDIPPEIEIVNVYEGT